jgi:hypothetical protein
MRERKKHHQQGVLRKKNKEGCEKSHQTKLVKKEKDRGGSRDRRESRSRQTAVSKKAPQQKSDEARVWVRRRRRRRRRRRGLLLLLLLLLIKQ